MKRFGLGLALAGLLASAASAMVVGETHLRATSATAVSRDKDGSPEVRVTIWYPAAADARETPRNIGSPGRVVFEGGSAADNATVLAGARYPTVLLSHGFGGSARMMSWFGTELARGGYVVIAVDHPGNNGRDKMTVAGATLWWERADDLRDALTAVRADARFAVAVDPARLGVAGFSAGGMTALVAAGARLDPARYDRFCAANPDDGICRPQVEMPELAGKRRADAFATPAMQAALAQAGADHAVPGVRAVFAMAPALVQAIVPESLGRVGVPVAIVLGRADTVAPPATNGEVAVKALPRATLAALDGVGHYDFLSTCTTFAHRHVPQCKGVTVDQGATHAAALAQARALFDAALK